MIYLTNARIPTEKAHGLQIMKMCEAFKNEGVDVELVVANRKNNQLENIDPFEYYGIKNKFSIIRLWLMDIVDMGRSFRGLSVPIQNTSFAISALRYLAKKKPDIIYSRDEFSSFFLSFFKKNIVLELHTFPKSKFFLYKFLLKRCRKVIVITNSLKKLLIEKLDVDQEKILVSADGVDINQYKVEQSEEDSRQKLDLPRNKNIILYPGHLFKWKGVYTLAECTKYLSDKELVVFVGGMDYDRDKLKKFIDEQNLQNIKFIGHQEPAKIPMYLKAADVVVLPNSKEKKISELYTSPIKMFEYMAAQKPIVASDLPSIREILNENNAVLVEPDNSKELAEGIKKVLVDKNMSNKLVNQAYQDVHKYTWQKRAQNILNFIK